MKEITPLHLIMTNNKTTPLHELKATETLENSDICDNDRRGEYRVPQNHCSLVTLSVDFRPVNKSIAWKLLEMQDLKPWHRALELESAFSPGYSHSKFEKRSSGILLKMQIPEFPGRTIESLTEKMRLTNLNIC